MRPRQPSINYGKKLEKQLESIEIQNSLVLTMEEPWIIVKKELGVKPKDVLYIESTEIEYLRNNFEDVAGYDFILGVGGGSAIDAAKYAGWKSSIPVIAIPTIASVDAVVTSAVATRKNGVVNYIGNNPPDKVIVNFPIIQSAPKRLNRAGLGDILSIHTALYDWRLAANEASELYDNNLAENAAKLLEKTVEKRSAIRKVSEEGIGTLIGTYAEINQLNEYLGSPRPEEGSEHFFAYTLEYLTGKHFVHGELVCLGVLLMSMIQDNEPGWVKQILKDTGVKYRPSDLDVTPQEIIKTFKNLKDYVNQQKLYYSIVDDSFPLSEDEVQGVLNSV